MSVQRNTLCPFTCTHAVCQVGGDSMKYFLICHCDGYFTLTSKSVRDMKNRSSNKINATYNTQMVISKDTNVTVTVH